MIVGGCNDCLHSWYSSTALNLNALLFVRERERQTGGRWKMRNGWSKSFPLTSHHHSQSLCDYTDWPSVKSILAVNTSVVLSIFHVATDIDQCQQDRFWYEQGRYKAVVLQWMTRVLVCHRENQGCVLCTIPKQNTDAFMYTLSWHVTTVHLHCEGLYG